ncbi:MAG: 4Fe-4S binding protein [Adlercreutzia equolifaciens]
MVRQDYDKCIGCRMCMSACPYNGVRSFNWEEPTYHLDFATGDQDVAPHQKHVVEKCTFCWHRLAKGLAPACALRCFGPGAHLRRRERILIPQYRKHCRSARLCAFWRTAIPNRPSISSGNGKGVELCLSICRAAPC